MVTRYLMAAALALGIGVLSPHAAARTIVEKGARSFTLHVTRVGDEPFRLTVDLDTHDADGAEVRHLRYEPTLLPAEQTQLQDCIAPIYRSIMAAEGLETPMRIRTPIPSVTPTLTPTMTPTPTR